MVRKMMNLLAFVVAVVAVCECHTVDFCYEIENGNDVTLYGGTYDIPSAGTAGGMIVDGTTTHNFVASAEVTAVPAAAVCSPCLRDGGPPVQRYQSTGLIPSVSPGTHSFITTTSGSPNHIYAPWPSCEPEMFTIYLPSSSPSAPPSESPISSSPSSPPSASPSESPTDSPTESPISSSPSSSPSVSPTRSPSPRPSLTGKICLITQGCWGSKSSSSSGRRKKTYHLSALKLLTKPNMRKKLEDTIKSVLLASPLYQPQGTPADYLDVNIFAVNCLTVGGIRRRLGKSSSDSGHCKSKKSFHPIIKFTVTVNTDGDLAMVDHVLFGQGQYQFKKDIQKAIKKQFNQKSVSVKCLVRVLMAAGIRSGQASNGISTGTGMGSAAVSQNMIVWTGFGALFLCVCGCCVALVMRYVYDNYLRLTQVAPLAKDDPDGIDFELGDPDDANNLADMLDGKIPQWEHDGPELTLETSIIISDFKRQESLTEMADLVE